MCKKLLIILSLIWVGFFCFQIVNAEDLININTATAKEIADMSLYRIGQAIAQNIIDYREKNGFFNSIDEIMEVSGIKSGIFERIKDKITVGDVNDEQEEEQDTENLGQEENQQSDEVVIDDEVVIIDENIINIKLGDIFINEFVSDPADGEVEWIELYNNSNKILLLDSCEIIEGSGAKTKLLGNIGISGDDKYFVIEKPKGYLNNKGDIINLFCNDILIDKVAYGNWENGEANAVVASDPYGVARKTSDNTFNNFYDFSVSSELTKGKANIIIDLLEKNNKTNNIKTENYNYSDNIIISEIFPNPFGKDDDEFIELFNNSDSDVNLIGWTLGDNSKKRYKIKQDSIIKANEYFIINRNESKIALNNSGDSVKLFQPLKDEIFQEVNYKKAKEGWSYNFDININKWEWSEIITPDKENIILKQNNLPEVDFEIPEKIFIGVPIIFDSSDTSDQDENDILKYFWDFGDGFINFLANPEHTYFKQGEYTVKLDVFDGKATSSKEKIIKVFFKVDSLEDILLENQDQDIIISEFMPNPEGTDADGEWIEIYNNIDAQINLLNWKIDDNEGGSKPYTFLENFILKAGKYLVIDREESGLALNNSFDKVRLFNNFGELIDQVEYNHATEGESFVKLQNGKWQWSIDATPNKKNIITNSFITDNKKVFKKIKIKKSKKIKIINKLEEIKQMEIGDKILASGIVAVKPNIFGSQYFYIVGSPGVQVYNYKKDFPNLKVGDFVEVNGELSMSNNEWRIKTKIADDIKIIGTKSEPEPRKINCEEVGDDVVGELVVISGEVVEKKGSSIYIDDGTNEALVYVKKATEINIVNIKEGNKIAITGIANKTIRGIRIMPRFEKDIVYNNKNNINQKILGEYEENTEWELTANNKKMEFFKYMLIVAVGVIIVLGGLIIKVYKK